MNHVPAQQRPRWPFPEVAELFSSFPAGPSLHSMFDTHLLRLEEDMREGSYEIRAEIPGIDPANDVEITVNAGVLTIQAERTEEGIPGPLGVHSYGSFSRSVTLPQGPTKTPLKPATTPAS